MAITLPIIRSLVRSNLDETTASNWTDVELNRLINQRYHRVYSAVVTVFEDYNVATSLLNTIASQQEYTSSDGVPTDIFKVRRVEINYDITNPNAVFQRCSPIHNIDLVRTRLADTDTSGFARNPSYYYIGNTLGFLPIPDKAGTQAIKLWYIPTLPDLTDASTTLSIPYPERYWHILVEGATSDALRFGQVDSLEADKFDAKFLAGIILMQEELEDKVAEESKGVIDVTGENLDFSSY